MPNRREGLISSALKRGFILINQGSTSHAGIRSHWPISYESHQNSADKVGKLVNEGLVTDITINSVVRYVMLEPLVQYLFENQIEEEGS